MRNYHNDHYQSNLKNTYTHISRLIHSPEFLDRHRRDKTAFTRQRTLTFPNLILHGLNLIKGSAQQELDNTFTQLRPHAFPVRQVTKSAYTQARSTFSHQAFVEINQHLVDQVYQQPGYRTWEPVGLKGNRLQIRLDGAYFSAFLGNRTHYCPAKAAKSALAQPDFRFDSLSPTGS